jgi:hypothetical protein
MISKEFMQTDSWPHVWTLTKDTRPSMQKLAPNMPPVEMQARRYYCFHCQREWWSDTLKPVGACPARRDKTEIGRLRK